MKKHEVMETNYYYVLIDPKQKWVAEVKPGTSQQMYLSSRISCIHVKEPNMKLIGFITVYNTHKARLEAIEHDIKADMVDAGFDHYGNDHFKVKFNRKGSRKSQYALIANAILLKAMQYCEQNHLKYSVTWVD